MVELADTLDLGSSAHEGIRVRLSVRLLLLSDRYQYSSC